MAYIAITFIEAHFGVVIYCARYFRMFVTFALIVWFLFAIFARRKRSDFIRFCSIEGLPI